MNKKIAYLGIVTCIMYFIVVPAYIITKSENILTIFELVTIVSAVVIILIFISILNRVENNSLYKITTIVSMGCTITLTSVVHFTNIAVIRNLITQGVNIPKYLQLGYWPSVVTAIDYLAWGLFVGCAFISTGLAISKSFKKYKTLKITLIISGILCLIGLLGTVIINENLWYIAPLGYGLGTLIVCIEMLIENRRK